MTSKRLTTMPERSLPMHLTDAQLTAARGGKSVHLTEAGTDLVLLRADVFERLRNLVYDDSPWTDEEMDLLAAEDADSLGWEGMDAYQDLDP
jgi:hypothetical protein